MPAIVTLTFNPCIDKSVQVPKLIPEKKMHCPACRQDPGGGGINVARGITRLGGDALAIFPSGGYHGQLLVEMLEREQVPIVPVAAKSDTRENWMVVENSSNRQFRFVMPGYALAEAEWTACLEELDRVEDVQFIVISGSMPPDFPQDIFERIYRIARKKDAKIVVDTSGEALKLSLKEDVYIVKPNLSELASIIVGFNLTYESVAASAREIIKRNYAQLVVVSMGEGGAIVVDRKTNITIKSPQVTKLGTVGAGDSLIAGMLYSLSNNKSIEEAAAFGVACGAASTMNRATELFHREDAEALYATMHKEFQDLLEKSL